MFLNALEDFEAPLRKAKPKKNKQKDKGQDNIPSVNSEVADLVGLEDVVGGEKPIWLARFNFVCLLNLPETIMEFGSVRNYFEGKYL